MRGVSQWIATGLGLACGLLASDARAQAFAIQRIATGVSRPVFVTAPPGDSQRIFILEQHTGRIRILQLASGTILATPFLTVAGLATGEEQGLLGLAFHPDYSTNGFFYVSYTDPNRKVVRYHVSANPNVADASSATAVLGYFQPASNHNGGWIGFGPDDLLYVATGDGGGQNDDGGGHTPGTGNAQDITSNWLGKILRVDVDGDAFPADPDRNYAIPANPFVGVTGDDEIWVYGLRNPWRPSFDRATGDLYIADVGQNTCEEIDLQPASSPGGENYGWRLREGTIATPTGGVGGPKPLGAIDPILDYPRSGGNICSVPGPGAPFVGYSVTGGYVYRGPIAALQGRYFFADYGTSNLWSFVWDGSAPAFFDGSNYTGLTDHSTDPAFTPVDGSIDSVSSFGEDSAGNLYITDLADGEVFRLPEPAGIGIQTLAVAWLWLLGRARTRRYDRRRPA